MSLRAKRSQPETGHLWVAIPEYNHGIATVASTLPRNDIFILSES